MSYAEFVFTFRVKRVESDIEDIQISLREPGLDLAIRRLFQRFSDLEWIEFNKLEARFEG